MLGWLAYGACLIPLLGSAGPVLLARARRRVVELYAVIVAAVTLALSMTVIAGCLHRELPLYFETLKVGPLAFSIFIDRLTLVMLFVVSVISFLVVVFSLGYMAEDPGYIRYYCFILLFIGGMLGLVLAGNLLYLYMFWEVVGLTSCVLIAHWYHKPEASRAGVKAFVTTRIGDTLLLIGIALLGLHLRALDYPAVVSKVASLDPRLLTLALLLAFGGAVGKSAQFPLHVWLPDAMEGPTTVSALIHAATMVKAGVYLVARLEALTLFYAKLAPTALAEFLRVVALIGGFTSLFAASMAMVAMDVKRVLAYSTISQLGFMFLALGLAGFAALHEAYMAGISHLLSHACFKALLFLSAGSVIHALGTRDMRMMGGLRAYMPVTFWTMTIGALALMGFPPLNGFWSKEMILAAASEAYHEIPWALFFFFATSILTAFYSFRLIYLVFLAPPSEHVRRHPPHEAPPVMIGPQIILAALCFLSPLVLRLICPEEYALHASLAGLAKSLLIIAAGAGTAYLVYMRRVIDLVALGRHPVYRALYELLANGYYIDLIYERYVLAALARAPSLVCSLIDRGVELFNRGTAALFVAASKSIRRTHTGAVSRYFALSALGVSILLLLALMIAG